MILHLPRRIIAPVGRRVELSVSAAGSPAPQYQWSVRGASIVSEASSSLSFVPDDETDYGQYTCTVMVRGAPRARMLAGVPNARCVPRRIQRESRRRAQRSCDQVRSPLASSCITRPAHGGLRAQSPRRCSRYGPRTSLLPT